MPGIASQKIEKLLETPELPELGPGPREGIRPEKDMNRAADKLFGSTNLPDEKQQLIRALVLLWHDQLDAAHKIVQDVENSDGAFVHGIVHRREPDYGNAAYWFRRAGRHAAFSEIANRVRVLLEAKGERELLGKLIPGGEWDAFAFIDACGQGNQNSNSERTQILREIQAVETKELIEWFCK